MVKTGFIGAGTTGTALAVRLSSRRWPIIAVSSRSLASARKLASQVPDCRVCETPQEVSDLAELVFITTTDDAIARVCGEVQWRAGQSVVHCSGAHSVDILEPARLAGAAVGSFHPLQTFAHVDHAVENLPGSAFALEAEEPLLSKLKQLAVLMNGNWVVLKPGDKVLYHAAAVFACNYLVTLVNMALELWRGFGASPGQATGALLPLLKGTVNNIGNIGLPNCLTGPVARGDLGTIERHLSALQGPHASLLPIYRELALQTIPIALAKGTIDEDRASEMATMLNCADPSSASLPAQNREASIRRRVAPSTGPKGQKTARGAANDEQGEAMTGSKSESNEGDTK